MSLAPALPPAAACAASSGTAPAGVSVPGSAPAGAVAKVHWEHLAALPAGVHPIALASGREGPVALGEDGALWALDAGAWSPLAPAPPGSTPVYRLLEAGPDGAFWIAGNGWVRRFDGRWQPREALGECLPRALAAGGAGREWIACQAGLLYQRTGTGWVQRSDVPAAQGDAGSTFVSAASGDAGEVWFAAAGGAFLVRAGPRGLERIATPEPLRQARPEDVPLAWSQGALLVGGPRLWELRDGTWRVVLDAPVDGLAAMPGGWWALGRDRSWRSLGGRLQAVPLPSRDGGSGLAVTPDGTPYCLLGGRPAVAAPGSAPALVEVTQAWGLEGAGGERGILVADLDGDGRDDVLSADRPGARLWVQGPSAFVDATAAWGVGAVLPPPSGADGAPSLNLAACDLDADGLPEVLGAGGGHDLPPIYLRNHGTFLERVLEGPRFATRGPRWSGESVITCGDLDGDRRLDVVVAGGVRGDNGPGGVAALHNRGWGRLAPIPLPPRGLGSTRLRAEQVLLGDLDGDGTGDAVVLAAWGDGPSVLRGLPGGGFEDVTRLTGLHGDYPYRNHGWLRDLDGDGAPDLVTADGAVGARVWKGLPGFRFADRTQAWGLGASRPGPEVPSSGSHSPAVLDDLDGDGAADLVVCGPSAPCRLWMGSPSGPFQERSGALPDPVSDVIALVSLDLGADGDRDLLRVRRSGAELWENRLEVAQAPIHPPAPRPGPRPGATLARRLAWVSPVGDGLPLALLAAALAWTHRLARREQVPLLRRGRVVLGLLGALGAAWTLAMDQRPAVRLGLGTGGSAGVLLVGAVAARAARRRREVTVAGYRLLAPLGRGGMGTVYRARDASTGARVALKVIHPELVAAAADRARYRAEAELGARVDDPRVVRILGYGEWSVLEAGTPRPTVYLVMELVPGRSLRQCLGAWGRLPVGPACGVLRDLALALHAVHRADVVHRDLKPENVMVLPGGGLKLMDFGAARTLTASTLTQGAAVLGTLAYAAPEQLRGSPPTPMADVYSLGVMAFELLTGSVPFTADNPFTLMHQVLRKAPPPLGDSRPDMPPGLETAVARALAKDAGDRFPDASAFAQALSPHAEPWQAPGEEGAAAPQRTPSLWPFPGIGEGPSRERPARGALGGVLAAWGSWRSRGDGPTLAGDAAPSTGDPRAPSVATDVGSQHDGGFLSGEDAPSASPHPGGGDVP